MITTPASPPATTPADPIHRPLVASVRFARGAGLPRVAGSVFRDHRVTMTVADLRERAVDRIRNPLIGGAR